MSRAAMNPSHVIGGGKREEISGNVGPGSLQKSVELLRRLNGNVAFLFVAWFVLQNFCKSLGFSK